MSTTKQKTIKLSSIKPNPENPRLIKDDKFYKLLESIKTFGEKMMPLRPIVIDENKIILGGNMRFKALKELGYKEVPADWIKAAKDLTEEQKKEFIIKDNVGFGSWDFDVLANEWDSDLLEGWGLDMEDFDFDNFTELEATDDNYEEPENLKVDVVLGDLIEIGEHRLLCGDSTDSDNVEKLMNGGKAELLFTSPPYSDMREYKGDKDLSINNLINFIPSFMPFVEYQVVNLGIQKKDNDIFQYWDEYINKARDCGLKLLSWNVWDRENPKTIAHQQYLFPLEHEWVFVFGVEYKNINYTKSNKYKYVKNKRLDNNNKIDKKLGSIISCQAQMARDEFTIKHEAPFPVEFPSEYIKAMTNNNDIVAEPFLGSGTTMVAAHQLKRKCYGMELDPTYCQVIIDRMTKLDPELKVKINGKAYEKKEQVPF